LGRGQPWLICANVLLVSLIGTLSVAAVPASHDRDIAAVGARS
jgi:hypothetical protein